MNYFEQLEKYLEENNLDTSGRNEEFYKLSWEEKKKAGWILTCVPATTGVFWARKKEYE